MPPYREIFRLEAWLSNTYEYEALSKEGEAPQQFLDLLHSVGVFVELAMVREGKNYPQMLEAIHAGEFDGAWRGIEGEPD